MKKSTIAIILSCAALGAGIVAGAIFLINLELNTTEDAFGFLDPSSRMAIHLGAGESYYEARLYQIAEAEFKRAQIASENTKYLTDRGEAYTRLGQTSVKLNKLKDALVYFEKADEYYDKAEKDEFVFKMEKRIHAKGLDAYEKILRKQGKPEQADLVAEELKQLTDELGPVEKLRGLFSDL
ncbi:MAG: hypothetical protein K2X77_22655 [Candidatus Obscuribacterales bacterium]|nr:hypothetical protein [Candidatus Obscuribacterales bacterium]